MTSYDSGLQPGVGTRKIHYGRDKHCILRAKFRVSLRKLVRKGIWFGSEISLTPSVTYFSFAKIPLFLF
jgi:hypothetical protein